MTPTRESTPVLLLDTHVWISYLEGVARLLSARVRRRIDRGLGQNAVSVSIVSVGEVASLVAQGRIRLSPGPLEWVRRALGPSGFALHPLTIEAAVEATRLPEMVGPDPVDRMLIAAAQLEGWMLVTRDERLLAYASTGAVRAVDARR